MRPLRYARSLMARLRSVVPPSFESVTPAPTTGVRSSVVILAGAWLVTLGTAWVTSTNPQSENLIAGRAPYGTLNPNRAPWYELALLPRIGEAKARAIVTYRRDADRGESNKVFRVADDLKQVSGIGPKTVQRLTPELRFED